MRRFFIVLFALALLPMACGEGDTTTSLVPSTQAPPAQTTVPPTTTTTTTLPTTVAPTTQPPTTTTTVPDPGEHFSVYMMLDTATEEPGPFLVPLTRHVAGPVTPLEAAQMLMRGLAFSEVGMGLSTAVPMTPGAPDALSVTIDGSVATVDLTSLFETGGGGGTFQMAGRLAQVVFTLTRFDEIDAVSFKIDGEPVTVFSSEGILVEEPQRREHFQGFMPAIFVEEPAFSATVDLPLAVRGLANVPDDTVHYALTDWDGLILAEGAAAVGEPDLGDFGSFAVTIDVEPPEGGLGALIVWAESVEDGSQQWVMEYPITLHD